MGRGMGGSLVRKGLSGCRGKGDHSYNENAMNTDDRKQIRTALIARFEHNPAPAGFSALAKELRAGSESLSGYRDSQILSVLYPLVNGGDLEYTGDLQISRPNADK